jgi:AraC family transcriptional regulator of adaptative response/methylated-DNA-[protein]-cysteine methyltransferase
MMTHRTFIKLYPAHVLDPSEPYIYGSVDTAYGPTLLISRGGYLLALGFTTAVVDLAASAWPKSTWIEDNAVAADLWQAICRKDSIKVVLQGTEFQQAVWQSLLDLEEGEIVTYQGLAHKLGKPKAFRAVANAVGANPISYLIPCHQVIRKHGGLGGYRWGLNVKKALLGKGI